MTGFRTLLVKYRLTTNTKIKSIRHYRHQTIKLTSFHPNTRRNTNTMSKALIRELDLKMQQVKEYGLIAHGYHNENVQYPVHVRRSHDGEKLTRIIPINLTNPTILTPSLNENRTKRKQNILSNRQSSYDERHTTLIVPPNKTVNDINPSLNRDRYHSFRNAPSSINSSPILCSSRPHSIAGISLPITNPDEQRRNSLSNSSQSLLNRSTSTKTLTKRFFSKLFHHPSKS